MAYLGGPTPTPMPEDQGLPPLLELRPVFLPLVVRNGN